ncbi:hypothetical protein Lal_00007028 [Lupinus albus]|nr:hypothetical protein Lal_00007028 [Lupinus albus]
MRACADACPPAQHGDAPEDDGLQRAHDFLLAHCRDRVTRRHQPLPVDPPVPPPLRPDPACPAAGHEDPPGAHPAAAGCQHRPCRARYRLCRPEPLPSRLQVAGGGHTAAISPGLAAAGHQCGGSEHQQQARAPLDERQHARERPHHTLLRDEIHQPCIPGQHGPKHPDAIEELDRGARLRRHDDGEQAEVEHAILGIECGREKTRPQCGPWRDPGGRHCRSGQDGRVPPGAPEDPSQPGQVERRQPLHGRQQQWCALQEAEAAEGQRDVKPVGQRNPQGCSQPIAPPVAQAAPQQQEEIRTGTGQRQQVRPRQQEEFGRKHHARGRCIERNCTGAPAPPRRGKIGTLVTNASAPDSHETHRPHRPVPRRTAEDPPRHPRPSRAVLRRSAHRRRGGAKAGRVGDSGRARPGGDGRGRHHQEGRQPACHRPARRHGCAAHVRNQYLRPRLASSRQDARLRP